MKKNRWNKAICTIGDAVMSFNSKYLVIIDDIDYENRYYIGHQMSSPCTENIRVRFDDCRLMAIAE